MCGDCDGDVVEGFFGGRAFGGVRVVRDGVGVRGDVVGGVLCCV